MATPYWRSSGTIVIYDKAKPNFLFTNVFLVTQVRKIPWNLNQRTQDRRKGTVELGDLSNMMNLIFTFLKPKYVVQLMF
jgi:hypothetical protein